MSRYEVDEIVDRVRRPTVASRGIERESEVRSMSARRQSSPRFTGCRPLPPSSGGLTAVNQRLFTPTHMTRMRAEKDIGVIIKHINGKIPSDSIVVAKERDESKDDVKEKSDSKH